MPTCSVPGCERPSRARGWCGSHYQRWRAHGTTGEKPLTDRFDEEARFWAKVSKGPGCHVWTASRFHTGHGFFRHARGVYAHRFAYELANDLIPDGMAVLHECDNAPCVRHDHLYLGDQRQNVDDRVVRNRSARGERSGKARLTQHQADEIRRLSAEEGLSQRKLAARFGVNHNTVGQVLRGVTYR